MKVTVRRKKCEELTSGNTKMVVTHRTVLSTNPTAACQFSVSKRTNKLSFSVTLDPTGGTLEDMTIDGIVGEKIGALPLPTYGENLFVGWFTESGTEVTEDTIMSSAVSTIYARWVEPTVITFDPAGGTLDGVSYINAYVGYPLSTFGVAFPNAIGTPETPNLSGWFTSTEGGERVTGETIYDGSYTTLYAMYVSSSYTVDLMGQWCLSDESEMDANGNYAPYQWNPDPSLYDGVFQSFSNWQFEDAENWTGSYAKMRITFTGCPNFRIYIRSWGEDGYDYVCAGGLDMEYMDVPYPGEDLDGDGIPDDYGDGITIATTRYNGYCNNGQSIEDYLMVEYPNDGGEHFIEVAYRKDSSYSVENDRGYVLIGKEVF